MMVGCGKQHVDTHYYGSNCWQGSAKSIHPKVQHGTWKWCFPKESPFLGALFFQVNHVKLQGRNNTLKAYFQKVRVNPKLLHFTQMHGILWRLDSVNQKTNVKHLQPKALSLRPASHWFLSWKDRKLVKEHQVHWNNWNSHCCWFAPLKKNPGHPVSNIERYPYTDLPLLWAFSC